jgi:hypothetical protein
LSSIQWIMSRKRIDLDSKIENKNTSLETASRSDENKGLEKYIEL